MASKKVRILADTVLCGVRLRPDDVAQLPDVVAKQAIADGVADATKAAVDYALESTGRAVVVIDAQPKE